MLFRYKSIISTVYEILINEINYVMENYTLQKSF